MRGAGPSSASTDPDGDGTSGSDCIGALAKLVILDPETAAPRAWESDQDNRFVSSDRARTELTRAVRRGPDRMLEAQAVLDGLVLLTVPAGVLAAAGRLDPVALRSLDAVHLAAAP